MTRKQRRRWQKRHNRRKKYERARNMRRCSKQYPNGSRIDDALLSPPKLGNPGLLAVLKQLFGSK